MPFTSLRCSKECCFGSVEWNVPSLCKYRRVHHFALRGQDCLSWLSSCHAIWSKLITGVLVEYLSNQNHCNDDDRVFGLSRVCVARPVKCLGLINC